MPTEPEAVTLTEVVHRAVQVVDPTGSEGLEDLLERFEDADEPLSSVQAEIVAQHLTEEIGALDPQAEDPAVQMAGAVATYLVFRRDELDEERGALLRARRTCRVRRLPARAGARLAGSERHRAIARSLRDQAAARRPRPASERYAAA